MQDVTDLWTDRQGQEIRVRLDLDGGDTREREGGDGLGVAALPFDAVLPAFVPLPSLSPPPSCCCCHSGISTFSRHHVASAMCVSLPPLIITIVFPLVKFHFFYYRRRIEY